MRYLSWATPTSGQHLFSKAYLGSKNPGTLHPQQHGAYRQLQRHSPMHGLAETSRLRIQSPRLQARVLRMRELQTRCSELSSCRESVMQDRHTSTSTGTGCSSNTSLIVNILTFPLIYNTVLIWEFAPLLQLSHLLILHLQYSTHLSFKPFYNTSLRLVDTLDLSPVENLKTSSDPFKLPPFPSFQSLGDQESSALYKISPIPALPLKEFHPSTAPSTQTISHAHGVPLQSSRSSYHVSHLVLKQQSVTSKKHTALFQLTRINGQEWLSESATNQIYSLLIGTTALVLNQGEAATAGWQMQEQTLCAPQVLDQYPSGSMITFSSGYSSNCETSTTPKEKNGQVIYRKMAANSMTAENYGTEERSCPMTVLKNSMRIWSTPSWITPLHLPGTFFHYSPRVEP